MQEEIELLRSLHHPNIVTYLGTDVCDDDQTLYIFTEWVPGGSIRVRKRARLMPAEETIHVALCLVGARHQVWTSFGGNCAQVCGAAACWS